MCPARLPSGWMGGWADATSYAPGQGAHRMELDDVPDDLGLLDQARARPVAGRCGAAVEIRLVLSLAP